MPSVLETEFYGVMLAFRTIGYPRFEFDYYKSKNCRGLASNSGYEKYISFSDDRSDK
jgi:hypothetical protein